MAKTSKSRHQWILDALIQKLTNNWSRIQTKLINFLFEVFNADGTKNREVTRVVPLEIKINGHKK